MASLPKLPLPVEPRTVYAAGLNYVAHIEWANSRGASHEERALDCVEVRVNGRTVSSYSTRGMIFSVAQYISRMSRYVTLHPNDVIWFGCDGKTEPALKPGDLVEVVNDAIGVLANRVTLSPGS